MTATAGSVTTSDGVELRWELRGDGPTIAFVNSFFMPSSGWSVFTERLVRRNRLLTYDLGPAGWSDGRPLVFDRWARDLDDVLDALGVESAYLLGHSSGTQVCVAHAAASRSRVRGLVLVGPLVNPGGGERRRAMVAAWRAAYESGGWAELFDLLWWTVHSEATLARAGRHGRTIMKRRFVELNEGTDPTPLFALSDTHQVEFAPAWEQLTMPALLLTGEDDGIATAGALRETRELIRDSRIALVPRAAHLVYLEATEAFETEVQRFVDGVEAARLSGAARSRGAP